MIETNRFAINRITSPALGLEDFFGLAADLGLSKVELRNDLPGAQVLDGVAPAKARAMAESRGVKVITINALQHFNVAALRPTLLAELDQLLDVAAELHCPALVLCPHNDTKDARGADARFRETVEALVAFGPAFEKRGMMGFVEPLGFAECSLPSIVSAADAIARSRQKCYRTVYDTFHHYLGPETEKDIGTRYAVSSTGLIHVSAVQSDIPKDKYRDEHRVLPDRTDRTFSREQVARHLRLGYAGDISFEPFSRDVQRMHKAELLPALRRSIEYLRG
jgi:2-keto-myo-inositol isomerase